MHHSEVDYITTEGAMLAPTALASSVHSRAELDRPPGQQRVDVSRIGRVGESSSGGEGQGRSNLSRSLRVARVDDGFHILTERVDIPADLHRHSISLRQNESHQVSPNGEVE